MKKLIIGAILVCSVLSFSSIQNETVGKFADIMGPDPDVAPRLMVVADGPGPTVAPPNLAHIIGPGHNEFAYHKGNDSMVSTGDLANVNL